MNTDFHLSKQIKKSIIYGKRFEIKFDKNYQYLQIITENTFIKNTSTKYLIPNYLRNIRNIELSNFKIIVIQVRMENRQYSQPVIIEFEKIPNLQKDEMDTIIYSNHREIKNDKHTDELSKLD